MNDNLNIINKFNRRKYQRFGVNYFSKIKEDDKKELFATIIDISQDGIGLKTPYRISQGKKLKIEFKYHICFGTQILNKTPIVLQTQILWVKNNPELNFRYGLKIIENCHIAIHKLKNLIQMLYFLNHYKNKAVD